MRFFKVSLSGATIVASLLAAGCNSNREPVPTGPKPSDAAKQPDASAADSKSANQTTDQKGEFNVSSQSWGKLPDGREAKLFTVTNPSGLQVKLTDYGAHLVSIEVPDRDGNLANVTLTFDDLEGYLQHTAYFGSTVGRYANRIAGGKFTLNGQEYTLPVNNGPNHLHGGPKGFGRQLWEAKEVKAPDAAGVEFTYVSKDGEEGYPGTLTATATYWLTKDNQLKIDYTAKTDKDTVVNLTNHAYWNLSGVTGKDIDIKGHELMLAADKRLVFDETSIPTGEIVDVAGTPWDFATSKQIGPALEEVKKTGERGFDHNYVLRGDDGTVALAARVKDPKSGRVMEIWTDQPGVQFYTSNFLTGAPVNGGFQQHAALCLETQHYPDSPNHPKFPSTTLKAGDPFKSTTIHKFSTE